MIYSGDNVNKTTNYEVTLTVDVRWKIYKTLYVLINKDFDFWIQNKERTVYGNRGIRIRRWDKTKNVRFL